MPGVSEKKKVLNYVVSFKMNANGVFMTPIVSGGSGLRDGVFRENRKEFKALLGSRSRGAS